MRLIRYIALVLAACGAMSCTTPQVRPGTTLVTGIDFTAYTTKGFLFTPEVYEGPYEAVGLITVTSVPDARQVKDSKGFLQWEIKPTHLDAVVDTMYARATAMGADAVMRFSSRAIEEHLDMGATRTILEVSGFAIKRAKAH